MTDLRAMIAMTPIPRPQKRAPRLRRPIARTGKPVRRRVTLGAKRSAAKKACSVDEFTWQAIVDFYGGLCSYCEAAPGSQQEHIVPLSRGGRNHESNVCVSCPPCNQRKGTQTWEPRRRHPFMEVMPWQQSKSSR